MKRVIAIISALFLVFTLFACGDKAEVETGSAVSGVAGETEETEEETAAETERTGSDVIEEAVLLYGKYGEEAWEKCTELIEELKALDPDAGDKWESIMKL